MISSYGKVVHKELRTVRKNLGVDIKAPLGTPVRAAASGKVALVGHLTARGTAIFIRHDGGYYSIYGHMGTTKVKQGQKVKVCQVIGTVGSEESMDGSKLFFQVSHGKTTINPVKWLKGARKVR